MSLIITVHLKLESDTKQQMESEFVALSFLAHWFKIYIVFYFWSYITVITHAVDMNFIVFVL